MLELGKYSVKLHRELGKQIVKTGVKKLIAVGQFCHEVGRAAEKEGLPSGKIFTVENAGAAVDIARRVLCKGDTVLLKGSRGIHLETIFEKF
jgi:UDP-N-acetylmuramoyl-tripeptide--D-alanyl-D-alanine ligase